MKTTLYRKNNPSPRKSRSPLLLFLPLFFIQASADIPGSHESPPVFEAIDIIFDTEPRMFPSTWYCKKINAQAIPLPSEYRTLAMDVLNKAFLKYPDQVLFQYLRKVYVLKSLTFFGVPYGGTNTRDIVYITYENFPSVQASDYVEGLFHHEFSSVLYKKFKKQFDHKQWTEINPSGFRYGQGGVSAIRNGEASMIFNHALHTYGFLNEYSQSDLEEDINVFAQNLFSGGEPFWNIVDTFDKIRQKTTIIIDFFHHIDPEFTEEYFRRLAYAP